MPTDSSSSANQINRNPTVVKCIHCDVPYRRNAERCRYCGCRSSYKSPLYCLPNSRLIDAGPSQITSGRSFSAAVASTASSFPRFRDLPVELRLMIWKEALPGPRVVYLQMRRLKTYHSSRVWSDKAMNGLGIASFFDGLKGNYEGRSVHNDNNSGPRELFGFTSPCTPPALLSVCRESYCVATRYYKRSFGTASSFPETWFDFDLDTLYLDMGVFEQGRRYNPSHLSCDAWLVKNLAVFSRPFLFNRTRSWESYLAAVISSFPRVKGFVHVARRHGVEDCRDLSFMDPIDIDETVAVYSEPYDPDVDNDCRKHNNRYATATEQRTSFDSSLFAREYFLRWSHTAKWERPLWDLPDIHNKIVTTTWRKNEFEAAKSSYMAEKAEFEVSQDYLRVTLISRDLEPLTLDIGREDSIMGLMYDYYRGRHLKFSKDVVLHLNGDFLDPDSSINETDLIWGDVIDVYIK